MDRRYGVKECWLVYPKEQRIEVVNCESAARVSFSGKEKVGSKVLPEFDATVTECLDL